MLYEYIATKEIAKQVRKELKAKYPNIKFSVKSEFDSISVNYIDGVPVKEVEEIVKQYRGYAEWDSNYCDYDKNNPVEFQGKTVKTYLRYVWANRDFSESYLKEVSDYVKATYSVCENDGVTVKAYTADNAYFDGTNINTIKIYGDIACQCNSNEPIRVQRQRKIDEERAEFEVYQKEQEFIKAAAIATQKLEEELAEELAQEIIPIKITPIDYDLFVDGKFASLNKNSSVQEHVEECDRSYYVKKCKITEVIELCVEDYKNFSEMLLIDFDWLAGKGGDGSTAQLREVDEWWSYTEGEKELWRQHSYNYCVLVVAPGREPLLIDPQGYKYARYLAFIVDPSSVTHLLPEVTSKAVPFPRKAIANEHQQSVIISSYGGQQTTTQSMANRELEVGDRYAYDKEKMTVEIILTPHPIEPVDLSLLLPQYHQYQVISEPIIYEPVQLSLRDDERVTELLEMRRDRFEEKREHKIEAYERLQQKHAQLSNSSCQAAKRMGGMY